MNEDICANSALGLGCTARTKGRLEKLIVKPVLLKASDNCNENRGGVIDTIYDVNIFMK